MASDILLRGGRRIGALVIEAHACNISKLFLDLSMVRNLLLAQGKFTLGVHNESSLYLVDLADDQLRHGDQREGTPPQHTAC